jgi:hypothetical protein
VSLPVSAANRARVYRHGARGESITQIGKGFGIRDTPM